MILTHFISAARHNEQWEGILSRVNIPVTPVSCDWVITPGTRVCRSIICPSQTIRARVICWQVGTQAWPIIRWQITVNGGLAALMTPDKQRTRWKNVPTCWQDILYRVSSYLSCFEPGCCVRCAGSWSETQSSRCQPRKKTFTLDLKTFLAAKTLVASYFNN